MTTSIVGECAVRPVARLRAATRTVRAGMLGLGVVGRAVVKLSERARRSLRERGIDLRIAGALVRDASRDRGPLPEGLALIDDADAFDPRAYDVLIEVLGGVEPAFTLVARALTAGVPVVTANKALLAARGTELRRLAAAHGCELRREASVIAGVPFMAALAHRPLVSRIERITGILNGTSNFVLSLIERDGAAPADAVRAAQRLGLAEADPARDLDGLDARDKLIVLLEECGISAPRPGRIETTGIGHVGPLVLAAAAALGGTIKPLVDAAWRDDGLEAFVAPAFVPARNPLARVGGQDNALRLRGELVGELFYSGPGAGPEVTAATIIDDLFEIAVRPGFGRGSRRARAAAAPAPTDLATPTPIRAPRTPWLLIVDSAACAAGGNRTCEVLAAAGVTVRASAAVECGPRRVLALLTAACTRSELDAGRARLRAAAHAEAIALRALED